MEVLGLVLTEVLRIVLPIAITAIVAWFALFLRRQSRNIDNLLRTKLSAEEYALAQSVAAVAVNAVEQIAANPNIQMAGAEKLAQAQAYVNEQFAKVGITMSAEEITALIEAAVRAEINNGGGAS